MGRRVLYTCDCCGSSIDLNKQIGILGRYSTEDVADGNWELLSRRYLCDKCLEKVLLFLSK